MAEFTHRGHIDPPDVDTIFLLLEPDDIPQITATNWMERHADRLMDTLLRNHHLQAHVNTNECMCECCP